MQEALNAKDSQLAVLRVRFEEAEKAVASERKIIEGLQLDNHRFVWKLEFGTKRNSCATFERE